MTDVGSTIDDIVTLDVSGRGIIEELHDGARQHHGESPTGLASRRLRETVDPGDEVFIVTGCLITPTNVQETDGPLGAASLARGVKQALGAHPTILAESEALPTVKAALNAYGLHVSEGPEGREADWTCSVAAVPTDRERARQQAAELLGKYDPAAVLAVERCSANDRGEFHNMRGENTTDIHAKTEPLFETDALTIGVGDGGNEIGMGTIHERVRNVVPNAADCGCGCGGGIAAATATDVLVTATVSNWGAYAIVAALDATLDTDALHDASLERRALVQAGMAGGIDPSGRTDGYCDALSPAVNASIVELLGAAAETGDMWE